MKTKTTHMLMKGTEGFWWTYCGYMANSYQTGRRLKGTLEPNEVDCARCVRVKRFDKHRK